MTGQRKYPRVLLAWQDLTDARLVHLYMRRDWSMRQIAACYGFAEDSIRKRLLRLGVTPRPRWERGHRIRVEVDVARALTLLRAGATLAMAAEEEGVSPQTLRRRLAEVGALPSGRMEYDRGEEVAP